MQFPPLIVTHIFYFKVTPKNLVVQKLSQYLLQLLMYVAFLIVFSCLLYIELICKNASLSNSCMYGIIGILGSRSCVYNGKTHSRKTKNISTSFHKHLEVKRYRKNIETDTMKHL